MSMSLHTKEVMFSAVRPPLHSRRTLRLPAQRPLRLRAAARSVSPVKLSSMTMSAPALTASSASSSLRTSTSIFVLKPATDLAACTASVIEPLDHTWLSFSMHMWLRSTRWASIPPTIIPNFSTRRKPGVVFLVPARTPRNPAPRTFWSSLRDSEAMPEHLERIFRATLSARSSFLEGPRTVAIWATGVNSVPSVTCHSTSQPSCLKTSEAKGVPASTPGDFPYKVAVSRASPTTNPP
mmetsp:Transcript_13026/g.36945  ORF Transcript_13026/g.36945 Transcript_13026/m.36945 type:complete len:238 (-) Transcript_13026:169-882(-)